MFETLSPAPPDAILGLTEAFKADTNPNKVNLGVGVYQDEAGRTPTLEAVRAAEAMILEEAPSKSYLPISGAPEYGERVREVLFGEGHELVNSGRAVTVHTPGGTGALRVGGDFLRHNAADPAIWVSTPTWANHRGIFTAAGLRIEEYPYYDAENKVLDFEKMLEALEAIPAGHAVLLHVCCHNPTGVDPSPAEWERIAGVARERGWLPFLDFAYQGLGESVEADRAALLAMLGAGTEMLVASSFSKNFSLYQDRVGALTYVGHRADHAAAVFSHIKRAVRVNYSNPPAHGGHIVRTILGSPELRTQWRGELDGMRDRIKGMRAALVDALTSRGVAQDFSFIARQNGMFSFSGLTDAQVAWLREEKSVYIVKGGRINVAGITPGNLDYLCDALAAALEEVE